MSKIKLAGTHFNNIYLGPEEDRAKYEQAAATKLAAPAAGNATIPVRIYLAQGNIADDHPINEFNPTKPNLEGSATKRDDQNPGVKSYVDLTITEGAMLGTLFAGTALEDTIWDTHTYSLGFLSAFIRSNQTYTSSGETVPPYSGPGIYTWTGWDVMYYPGIFAPGRVEQYPQLALGQMPVVTGNQAFTIHYVKTSITFERTANNELYLLG